MIIAIVTFKVNDELTDPVLKEKFLDILLYVAAQMHQDQMKLFFLT